MADESRAQFRERLLSILRRCPDIWVTDAFGMRRRLVLLTNSFEEFEVSHYPTPDLWVMEVVLSITRKWTVYRPYIQAYRARAAALGVVPSTL